MDSLMRPLPYTSDTETLSPDERETVASIIASMRQEGEIVAERRGGHAVRVSHAKSTGAVVGTLVVAPNLPPELAQGLFARPGTYEVAVRFAQGPGEHLPDSVSTHRGMAIKVFGVEGARIEGHDAPVQDFVLATGTTFPSGTAEGFLRDSRLLTAATPLPTAAKGAVSALARTVERTAEAMGTSVAMADFYGHPFMHPLAEPYFSQAPMRWGTYVAKVGAFPVGAHQRAMRDMRIDVASDADAFRHALEETMAREGATFELRAQLWTNAETQPIEDASVEWSADETPYRTVATIVLPPQPGHDARRARFFDENLVFRPSHSLEAHRPIGSVMRARLEVYRALSRWRHALNREQERNPADVGAIPAPTSYREPAHRQERLQERLPATRDDRRRREGATRNGIAPGTALALGLGGLVLGAVAYAALAPRRADDRPPDDAEPRLRHDGAWDGHRAVAGKSVLINRTREEVYAFYRDPSNLPRFMANVREVRGGAPHSTWVMRGLAGGDVEVEVETVEDRPDERIAWRSVEGAALDMEGHVEFRDAPAGRGTYVVLEMDYRPPLGALGRAAATLTRRSAQTELRHGLRRLKMLLETGEIATSAPNKEAR